MRVMFYWCLLAALLLGNLADASAEDVSETLHVNQRGAIPPTPSQILWDGKFSGVDYVLSESSLGRNKENQPVVRLLSLAMDFRELMPAGKQERNGDSFRRPELKLFVAYRDLMEGEEVPLPDGTLCRLRKIDLERERITLVRTEPGQSDARIVAPGRSLLIPEGAEVGIDYLARSIRCELARDEKLDVNYARVTVSKPQAKWFYDRNRPVPLGESAAVVYPDQLCPIVDVGFAVHRIVLGNSEKQRRGWLELDTTPVVLETILGKEARDVE